MSSDAKVMLQQGLIKCIKRRYLTSMDQSELVQKYGMGKCATRHSSLSYDTQRRFCLCLSSNWIFLFIFYNEIHLSAFTSILHLSVFLAYIENELPGLIIFWFQTDINIRLGCL